MMTPLTFSVKLTREEYMDFCVKTRRQTRWPAIAGVLLVIGAVGAYFLENSTASLNWLLLLLGLIGLTAEPLWLPLWEKGAAGRRYDASDWLRQAATATLDTETLTVHTACHDGVLPLALVTQVHRCPDMMALEFGNECAVYIPRRALTDEEWRRVCEQLTPQ